MSIKAPTESDLLAVIRQWLTMNGAKVIRINSGAVVSEYKGKKRFIRYNDTPGCSDLLVCWRGRFLSVEVKRKGYSTDPKRKAKQEQFAREVELAGGIALTVESMAELEADLREAGLI